MLLFLMATTAQATPDDISRWQVSVASERIAWLASVAWLGSKAHGVDLRWRPPIQGRHDIELGISGRLLSTTFLTDGAAGELGMLAAYAPGAGIYQPSIGLELGWSGGVKFDWADYFGEGWQEQDPVARADYAPWYAGVACEPLRLSVRRLSVSALGLSVGQMGRGRVVRARVALLGVGAQW